MNYIEVTVTLSGETGILSDLIIQDLGEIGFEIAAGRAKKSNNVPETGKGGYQRVVIFKLKTFTLDEKSVQINRVEVFNTVNTGSAGEIFNIITPSEHKTSAYAKMRFERFDQR